MREVMERGSRGVEVVQGAKILLPQAHPGPLNWIFFFDQSRFTAIICSTHSNLEHIPRHIQATANLDPLLRPVQVLRHNLHNSVQGGFGCFAVQKSQSRATSNHVHSSAGVLAGGGVVYFGLYLGGGAYVAEKGRG